MHNPTKVQQGNAILIPLPLSPDLLTSSPPRPRPPRLPRPLRRSPSPASFPLHLPRRKARQIATAKRITALRKALLTAKPELLVLLLALTSASLFAPLVTPRVRLGNGIVELDVEEVCFFGRGRGGGAVLTLCWRGNHISTRKSNGDSEGERLTPLQHLDLLHRLLPFLIPLLQLRDLDLLPEPLQVSLLPRFGGGLFRSCFFD